MLFPTPKSQRQLFGIEFLGPSEEFNAEKAKFNAERVFPTPKGYFQRRKAQRRRAAMDALWVFTWVPVAGRRFVLQNT